MDRRSAEMTPGMARALGLLPDDDAPAAPTAPPERGIVSAAITASRRTFGTVRGFQMGESFAILLQKRADGYDYLRIEDNHAELRRVVGGYETTLSRSAIQLTTKERIQLCELPILKA